MALIKCPECGKEFSSFSDRCPNCGCPTSVVKKLIEIEKSIPSKNENTIKKEGNSIYFGSYYQKDDKTKEPIKWNILKTEGKKALIITDKIIDTLKFDEESRNYENSFIRRWLNNEFYNNAFNEQEKALIEKTLVDNSLASTTDTKNPYVCKDTLDKVFLLSVKEVQELFKEKKDRITSGTEYAKSKDLYISNDNSYWFLRSPNGDDGDEMVYGIDYDGCLAYLYLEDEDNFGVRPALWIKFDE